MSRALDRGRSLSTTLFLLLFVVILAALFFSASPVSAKKPQAADHQTEDAGWVESPSGQERETVKVILFFEPEETKIAPEDVAALKYAWKIASSTQTESAPAAIVVRSFTDNKGSQAKRAQLCVARAKAVERILLDAGCPSNILSLMPLPSSSIGDNATAEGRARNRRAEVFLSYYSKKIEKPVGGE